MIDASSITAGYDKFRIQDVSLGIRKGVFCALAGPNGSGKTTLMKTLCGGLRPIKGCVKISGKDIYSMKPGPRAGLVSYVPPEFHAVFPFTVKEIVMMGRNPHLGRFERPAAADFDIAREAMITAGCLHLEERRVNELSSGQRQAVLIARAICQQSPVMLLDEPASHLDAAKAARMFGILSEIAAAGRTVIAVMHDLGAAAAYCEKIILMKEGAICAGGVPEAVLRPEILEEIFGGAFEVKKIEGRVYVSPERRKS